MKRVPALIALCVLLAGVEAADARLIEQSYHETFPAKPGTRLRLEHGDGDVKITPWDRDEIVVDVEYRADVKKMGFGSEAEFAVDFRQNANTVVVSERHEGNNVVVGFYTRRTHVYEYTIRAPDYVELDLHGDDGEVQIQGWRAALSCELDDGDVILEDVRTERVELDVEDGEVIVEAMRGELNVSTDDGDVRLIDCDGIVAIVDMQDGDFVARHSTGDFDIECDDGDIDLQQVAVGSLRIRAADGQITLQLSGIDEVDWSISSDDGDVRVDVDPDVSARFVLESDDGTVRADTPGGVEMSSDEQRAEGELGAGRGRLRVETDGGDVRLSVRGS